MRRNSLARCYCYWFLAVFLPGVPSWVQADDIVIGMSAAFSGPSAPLGIELYRGSMTYITHINSTGGVNGRQVVLKAYDDKYDPVPAVDNTISLIERDQVFLLFDYVGTPTVTRVLPLLKRYSDHNIALFFPYTGAQPQREPPYDAFVFNLQASYRQETEGLVKHFVQIGRKRIAVLYQADAYGRSGGSNENVKAFL
ncbi:MAG TPA: ABC transporter substrate-binding protein [Candidatus Binatia bacterium]|nr:ABC transporter substrate-binding protein [Candidatus Binatia bacterium]